MKYVVCLFVGLAIGVAEGHGYKPLAWLAALNPLGKLFGQIITNALMLGASVVVLIVVVSGFTLAFSATADTIYRAWRKI
jgi:hypothetical protein